MSTLESSYSSFRGRGSLEEVVTELRRQIDSRNDFVIDTRDLAVGVGENGELRVMPAGDSARDFVDRDGFAILDQALTQLGSKATPKRDGEAKGLCPGGIPGKFLRTVSGYNPKATAEFLTSLIQNDPRRRMVRVLDGNVRAFLSDSYRAIDNYDVASHALRTLQDCGGRVIEASLSDSKMRIKMISPEIWETIERKRTSAPSSEWYAGGLGNAKHLARVAANSVGNLPMHGGPDTVNPLGELGNSETGHGGLYYKGGILQAICFNLATVQEVLRNVHLGSRQDIGHMTQETIRKEADVIFSKLRDTVSAFFTAESFRAIVEQCRATAGQVLLAPSMAIGALVESDDRLGDDDLLKLVDHLSGQPVDEATVYDVGQAVSRYAQDTADDDMAIDLEALAGEILTGKHSRVLVEAS